MYKVRKRNGKVVNFEIGKISAAMKKAFEATEKNFDDDMIDFLAIKVTADFENKIKDGIISVEDIQDSVESVLIKGDYADVFGCYNGWKTWKDKSISREYSKLASEIRETLYNKSPEELFTQAYEFETANTEVENVRGL